MTLGLIQQLTALNYRHPKITGSELVLATRALIKGAVKEKSYDDFVDSLVKKLRSNEMAKGMSDEALKDFVKTTVSCEEFECLTEEEEEARPAENPPMDDQGNPNLTKMEPAENPEDEKRPRVLATAGDYKIELVGDEQIHIVDSKGSIRLSLPLVIWRQLARTAG